MPIFQYKGHGADQTPVEGQIDADDLKSALVSLEARSLQVSSIHEIAEAQVETESHLAAPPAEQSTEVERPAWQRHLNRILEAGKPLAPALLAYAEELPPGRRRRRLKRMAHQLERGHDPHREPATGPVDEEWIPLLIAGASSGEPNQIPSQIIDEVQRAGDLRERLASTLAYPLTMLAVSLVILLGISLWIVPAFGELFEGFAVDLPTSTHLVLGISQSIGRFGWVLLIPGLLLAAILVYHSRFRNWLTLRIPLIGATVRLSDRARFTRYLADLMEAGVPVTDALRLCGRHTGQSELRLAAHQLATEMDSHDTELHNWPSCDGSLPHTLVYALQLRSNPTAAAQILRELSWLYDQQTRHRLAWVSGLAEPLLIVFLGTAVGFYVIALFLPFINLIQQLT